MSIHLLCLLLAFVVPDDPKKDTAPAFSETSLNETIRWLASLDKRLEVARVQAIKEKNELGYGKVRDEVLKELALQQDRMVRWPAKVVMVRVRGTQVEKTYTHQTNSIQVMYGESSTVSSEGLEGVKPGDWVWVNATVRGIHLPSATRRPGAWTITVSPTLVEKSEKTSNTESKPDEGTTTKNTSEKDTRTAWSSKDGTRRFEKVRSKIWRETKLDDQTKKTSLFEEVNRNADYIELQRGEDRLRVRIHNEVYYWAEAGKDGSYVWKENADSLASRGAWKKP